MHNDNSPAFYKVAQPNLALIRSEEAVVEVFLQVKHHEPAFYFETDESKGIALETAVSQMNSFITRQFWTNCSRSLVKFQAGLAIMYSSASGPEVNNELFSRIGRRYVYKLDDNVDKEGFVEKTGIH